MQQKVCTTVTTQNHPRSKVHGPSMVHRLIAVQTNVGPPGICKIGGLHLNIYISLPLDLTSSFYKLLKTFIFAGAWAGSTSE